MEFDVPLIRQFLEALTGDPDALVCWQVFDDSKLKRDHLARCWHGRLDLDVLRLHQDEGCGVFVAINETNGLERKAATIQRVRACFCDNDSGAQLATALEPSFWTVTFRGENPFWLADGPISEFSYVQHRLARFYGTDKSVKDPSRVMRVPGTWHLKGEPRLVGFKPGINARYTFQEILDAHPLADPERPNTKKYRLVRPAKAWIETRGKLVRHKASARLWAEGNRHAALLETLTHARKFWLPDDHVRSIAYEYGLPAGLPDREIEKVYEWVTVSVDPSPDDDPALRVAEVSEVSTEASPEPEPEAESLPDEIVKAYMEILGIGSPTLRERKIKEAAVRFGISVLTVKAEISEMRKREKTSSAQPEDTTYIDLSGLPWICDWKGVIAARLSPGGFKERLENEIVATRPIWPAALGEDVTTGEPHVLLKWFDQYDQERSAWFSQTSLRERETLRAIPGACIGASRINRISDYLADAEARVKDVHRKLTTHLGWVGGSWVWHGSEEPAYLGDPLPKPGDLAAWRAGVEHLLTLGEAGYPALICLAASAGSPLVRIAGRRNPVIALACQTSTGKGTAINYALSIWTDPALLTLPASSTIKGAQDRAMWLPDAPLFADELHGMTEEDIARMLYFLGNGQRRITSSVGQKAIGGQRRYGTGFAAAELDLVSGGHGGVGTRVIEIRDSPLPSAEPAAILRNATRHAGAAGMLLSAILTPDKASLLDTAVEAVRRRCSELHGDDENSLAVTWAGGWLLSEALDLTQDWVKRAMEWLIAKHSESRKSHVDKVQAAWNDICDTFAVGRKDHEGTDAVYVGNEIIGWSRNPVGTFDVYPRHPRIVQICQQAGGAHRLFAALADRGFIVTSEGHNTMRRRVGGELVRVLRGAPAENRTGEK